MNYQIDHLRELEAESIYVMREVAAQFENPVLMFSGGKDSILMVYLAYKAFHPAKIPFSLLHVDTGHNFDETIRYRDELVERFGARLVVEMSLVNGIQKTKDQNFGIFLMAGKIWVSTLEYSRYQTGQN